MFDKILNTPLKGIPKWFPKKSPGQSCSALHTIKAWYFETLKPRKIFETFLRKTVMEQFMIYYETQKLATLDLLNLQQSCTILKGKRLHQTQAMFFLNNWQEFFFSSHNVCAVYCLRTEELEKQPPEVFCKKMCS